MIADKRLTFYNARSKEGKIGKKNDFKKAKLSFPSRNNEKLEKISEICEVNFNVEKFLFY